jgi:type IV pilus assembly protein PilM
LPAGAVVEQEIKNPHIIAKGIIEAFTACNFSCRDIAIAVADSTVITKNLTIAANLPDHEIEDHVLFEAARQLPFALEELSIDFQILQTSNRGSGQNPDQIQVLLVAAHRDKLAARIEAVSVPGIKVKIVDIQSYAIERVFPFMEINNVQTIAIADIDTAVLTLTILHDEKVVFTRTEVFEQTPSFKESVVIQIRRALQFFLFSGQQQSVQTILLIGSGALVTDIDQFIAEHVGIETRIGNPLAEVAVANHINVETFNHLAPQFALCFGLALRAFPLSPAEENHAKN